jgi:rRNA maturation endonuclease Nob1
VHDCHLIGAQNYDFWHNGEVHIPKPSVGPRIQIVQVAEREDLERRARVLESEREAAEAVAAAAAAARDAASIAMADIARREAAVEARCSDVGSRAAALAAAQAGALQQLEALESSLRGRLERHQQQVRQRAPSCCHVLRHICLSACLSVHAHTFCSPDGHTSLAMALPRSQRS